MELPCGGLGGIKNTTRSPRDEGEARGLRDGIFDTALAPIWYFYNIFSMLKRVFFQTILAQRSDACQITSKLKIVLNP